MVGSYSSNYSITEFETIRKILYGKVFNNLKKHNMILSRDDIEDIVSELITWVLEKRSNTNKSKTIQTTIPFVSDKLISMFIASFFKHKYYEIPFTSLFTSFITDTDDDEQSIEHLMYMMYINNNVDEINIDDIDDFDDDKDQNQVDKKLDDDFQIIQIVDELMDKLELERKKRYNDSSKFIVSKKLIRNYLYLLLKHGIDDTYRYKDTLSDGKKYRLEKNLELLSTLV